MIYRPRPAIGYTPYNGSATKFMSEITYWNRNVYHDCKEAFVVVQSEIQANEDGITAETETERRISAVQLRRDPIPSDDRLERLQGNLSRQRLHVAVVRNNSGM